LIKPSPPSSSKELALGLKLESDVKPVIFGPAFTFTRLDMRCLDVRRVMRTLIEDSGDEDTGDDNNAGDSDRFLSFFGASQGAYFLAGCFAAGGRLVFFLLGGIVYLFRVRQVCKYQPV